MSSRLKKIRRRPSKKSVRAGPGRQVLDALPQRPPWMTLEEAEADGPVTAGEFHMTQCTVTGQTYVRRYDGRFRHLPQEQLQRIVAEMERIVRRSGGMVGFGGGIPLWWHAEMLDNILDFDLHSPCGCPSQLAPLLGAA